MPIKIKFVFVTILASLFKESLETPNENDPCVSPYSKIDDYRRSVSFTSNSDNPSVLCDTTLKKGWYRVTSKTGELMPTQCPQIGACGTYYGIWLKGGYPRENQTVTRDVYVSGISSCEEKFYTIKIRNCWNAYHLYWLVSTNACPEAYCFGKEVPCPHGTSSENGLTPNCEEYPKDNVTMEVTPHLMYRNETNSRNHSVTHHVEVVFTCGVGYNVSAPLYYDVYWYINGEFIIRIKNQLMGNYSVTSLLREEHWINKHQLNMMIRCSVRLRYEINGAPSPQIFSKAFEAGLKIEKHEYAVKEAETISIPIWITIPVGCTWTTNLGDIRMKTSSGIPTNPCGLNLRVAINKYSDKDGNILFKNKNCIINIATQKWQDIHYINISGPIDFIYNTKPRISNITAFTYNVQHKAWKKVQTSDIMVTIEDSENQLRSYMCKLLTGLHIITFDRSTLRWKTPGEYVLYENKIFAVQINIRIQKCRHFTRQLCICGLAIWNGEDFVLINFCSAKYDDVESCEHNIFMTRGTCANNLTSISRIGNAYKIILFSGTEVIFERSEHFVWYVLVKPSSYDRNSTGGICGSFNGNLEDDSSSDMFFKSWRVTESESLFDVAVLQNREGNIDLPTCCQCTSNSNENWCGHFVRDHIPESREVIDFVVIGSCNDEHVLQSVDASGFKTYAFSDEGIDTIPPIKDGSWRNGWSEALAKYTCRKQLLNTNVSVNCKENFPYIQESQYYDICIQFVESSGGLDLIFIVQGALFTECVFESFRSDLEKVDVNVTSAFSVKSVTQELFDMKCLSSCTDNGLCINGTCVCHQEFTGYECSERRTTSPLFTQCSNSLKCDSVNNSCNRVLVSGSYFDDVWITCKFKGEKLLVRNTSMTNISSIDVFETNGKALNSDYGICEFPVTPSDEAIEYTVSVSNRNSSVFKEGIKILIFNSECFHCNSSLITCKAKTSCKLKLYPQNRNVQKKGNEDSLVQILTITISTIVAAILISILAWFVVRRIRKSENYESSPEVRTGPSEEYDTVTGSAQNTHNMEPLTPELSLSTQAEQHTEIDTQLNMYDEIQDTLEDNFDERRNNYIEPITNTGVEAINHQDTRHDTATEIDAQLNMYDEIQEALEDNFDERRNNYIEPITNTGVEAINHQDTRKSEGRFNVLVQRTQRSERFGDEIYATPRSFESHTELDLITSITKDANHYLIRIQRI